MKRLLRTWSRDLAGAARVFAARRTDPADVAGLIAELRPVPCGREPIRLGPPGDGGYLVPDDLAGIGSCFSPGVDRECRFELDCAARGMRVFMADASVAGPRRRLYRRRLLGRRADQSVLRGREAGRAVRRPG